jgi:membrane protein
MNFKTAYELVRDSASAWSEDKAPRLGAALAYYSIFSLAPLLIIAIAIAGFAFGTDAAERQVVTTLDGLLGKDGAEAVHELLKNAHRPGQGILATVIGVGTLMFGASGLFGQLKDALNTVWGVTPRPGMSIWGTVRERFFSITMVLGTGFLLLVSLLLSAAITALSTWFSYLLPGMDWVWQAVNVVLGFALTAGIFAALFRLLPDARVAWKDVWVGAAITSVLFAVGRFVLGYYLASSSVAGPFGAAGSLVIVLLWVYYTAQIMLFGAEFTKVYANRCGEPIQPDANAVLLSEHDRVKQGIPSEPGGMNEKLRPDRPQYPGGITFIADGADAEANGYAPDLRPAPPPER